MSAVAATSSPSAPRGGPPSLLELDERGFVHAANVLEDDDVVRLGRIADQLAMGYPAPLHLLGAAFAHPAFTDLAVHPRLLPFLASALSPNLHLYHSHLDCHPAPASRTGGGWHRDGGRMSGDLEVSARLSIKVAFWLTDLEEDGLGNLEVVPGSHRRRRAPAAAEQPRDAVAIRARAGDALLFDRRLWHRRGVNRSERTRVALFFAYAPRWVSQRERPGAVLLDGERDPLRRQVLGAPDWDPCQVALGDLPLARTVHGPCR